MYVFLGVWIIVCGEKKSVRMNFPAVRMINECVQILWLVTGVLGCTFGISNLKTKDYVCITERD